MQRSSILKSLKDEACVNRQICEFARPHNSEFTPYDQLYFSESTRKICTTGVSPFLTSLKICKAIILGDVSVGKTSIVNRFCHQVFDSGYKATIGVDFEVERFDILNVPFHLQIWDTAGQERFKCIAQSYYRSAHVIIVVFDFTSMTSLSHCKNWLGEALSAAGNSSPFIFLVGTKMDKVSHAAFSNVESSATHIAVEINAEYWPVSSKTGENIEGLFFRIASLTFDESIAKEKEKLDVRVATSDVISFKGNSKEPSRSYIGSGCRETSCRNS